MDRESLFIPADDVLGISVTRTTMNSDEAAWRALGLRFEELPGECGCKLTIGAKQHKLVATEGSVRNAYRYCTI